MGIHHWDRDLDRHHTERIHAIDLRLAMCSPLRVIPILDVGVFYLDLFDKNCCGSNKLLSIS